ncbi:MAG: hypothetical protein OEN21_16685 [Myxococcales bacterium]|nr:hypothetical protein [Myxococcales bacterium]
MQIEKELRDDHAPPNLRDYDQGQASFSWEDYGKIASFEDAISYVAARV